MYSTYNIQRNGRQENEEGTINIVTLLYFEFSSFVTFSPSPAPLDSIQTIKFG